MITNFYMSRIFVVSFIIIFFTISCTEKTTDNTIEINKKDLIGEWSSKNEEEFLLFKDSVVLPLSFYLFSNWKFTDDKIQLYDIESESDSLWVNYFITGYYRDSLVLKSTVFNEDSTEVIFYRRPPVEQNIIKSITLTKNSYPGETEIFKIQLNDNGEVYFSELTQNEDTLFSICSLDQSEMNILNSMIHRVDLPSIDSLYVSGISDQGYYSIDILTTTLEKPVSILVDTGGVAPNMIVRIMTFIWATTKLKCTPSRYNDWKISSSSIY
ncbi:hypothetical protein OKW21_005173 [Catalinimonas alkaloidigena]|uniref:hypothetical protein n=1 Tax=Catalinimonas alkaloidigena TaxID=1075417 RepID=UPI0024071C04|nr:hypothetical protein [Catalinimonas alkaloidigena]MDF9799910.1 hypothetical protein [Catalinimonas alkaloidigena]